MLKNLISYSAFWLVTISLILVTNPFYAQNTTENDSLPKGYIGGQVLNASTDKPLSNVNIVNINSIEGTITDQQGHFKIKAEVGDTLYFSYLGFKSLQLGVTHDWMKYGEVKIKMTEIGYTLETVEISNIQLTGFLEIDAKSIPIYSNYRYKIPGLDMGYEAGGDQPGSFAQTVNSILDPASLLYRVFGDKPQQLRKLREMKENDEIRRLLAGKFDRETLAVLLQIDKVSILKILEKCDYSKSFIKNANDLQILEAISNCYENYRVLKGE